MERKIPVEKARQIREELPENVKILAATKGRSFDEIESVLPFVDFIGENYVQEAEEKFEGLTETGKELRLIGHLQKNKINDAITIFDSVDSVDSIYRAKHINKRVLRDSEKSDVVCPLPVMLEVNIAEEDSKYGVPPEKEDVEKLAESITGMEGLKLEGMMTMGPHTENPEKLRPLFRRMKELFDHVEEEVCSMEYLSMGMSGSYKVAVEEGSNLVRIGTGIFGPREY